MQGSIVGKFEIHKNRVNTVVDPYALVTQLPWKRVSGQSCGLCVCAPTLLSMSSAGEQSTVMLFHPELLSGSRS